MAPYDMNSYRRLCVCPAEPCICRLLSHATYLNLRRANLFRSGFQKHHTAIRIRECESVANSSPLVNELKSQLIVICHSPQRMGSTWI